MYSACQGLVIFACPFSSPTVTGRIAEEYASPDLLRWIDAENFGFLGAIIMLSITCVAMYSYVGYNLFCAQRLICSKQLEVVRLSS